MSGRKSAICVIHTFLCGRDRASDNEHIIKHAKTLQFRDCKQRHLQASLPKKLRQTTCSKLAEMHEQDQQVDISIRFNVCFENGYENFEDYHHTLNAAIDMQEKTLQFM